jgi:hypothetical protein
MNVEREYEAVVDGEVLPITCKFFSLSTLTLYVQVDKQTLEEQLRQGVLLDKLQESSHYVFWVTIRR